MYVCLFFIKAQLKNTVFDLLLLVIIGGMIYCLLTWIYLSCTKNEIAKEIRNQILKTIRRGKKLG